MFLFSRSSRGRSKICSMAAFSSTRRHSSGLAGAQPSQESRAKPLNMEVNRLWKRARLSVRAMAEVLSSATVRSSAAPACLSAMRWRCMSAKTWTLLFRMSCSKGLMR